MREELVSYLEGTGEISLALMMGYEITYLRSGETEGTMTLMRYKSGDKALLIVTLLGTRKEIDDLQRDPIVKFFSPYK